MMAFAVPQGHEGLSRQVFSRFRSLIVHHVIDFVTPTAFDAWKRNFESDEEQYLAAQLLCAAVMRTRRMNNSSFRQIIDVILPGLLKKAGLWTFRSHEAMEDALHDRALPLPVRFMPVDGQRLDERPGNSGDAVLRDFGLQTSIRDGYMQRADNAEVWRDPPRLLILLDDLLGTGSQFTRFATRYELSTLPDTTTCVYVPLMASPVGIDRVARECPRVVVCPVETLQRTAPFFTGSTQAQGIWARDRYNEVAHVRQFYKELMRRKRVTCEGRHSLDLCVLLPDRPPNNTLRAYWSDQGDWHPLLRR